MTFCSNCGLLLPDGADRCPRCGAGAPPPFTAQANAPQPHYQGAAATPSNTMTTGRYFLYLCLFSLPVAGFVIALVFAFKRGGSRARRQFARAAVLYMLLLTAALLVLYLVAGLAAYWAMLPSVRRPWM